MTETEEKADTGAVADIKTLTEETEAAIGEEATITGETEAETTTNTQDMEIGVVATTIDVDQ